MNNRALQWHRWKTPSCPSLPRLVDRRLTEAEQKHAIHCKYCQLVIGMAARSGCARACAAAAGAGAN